MAVVDWFKNLLNTVGSVGLWIKFSGYDVFKQFTARDSAIARKTMLHFTSQYVPCCISLLVLLHFDRAVFQDFLESKLGESVDTRQTECRHSSLLFPKKVYSLCLWRFNLQNFPKKFSEVTNLLIWSGNSFFRRKFPSKLVGWPCVTLIMIMTDLQIENEVVKVFLLDAVVQANWNENELKPKIWGSFFGFFLTYVGML